MSELRFNHVFAALMLLCVFSAFVLPPRFTNPARGEFAGLFAPISHPVRGIAGLIRDRFDPQPPIDLASPSAPRPAATLLEENHQLLTELSRLTVKLEQLNVQEADRQRLGDIGAFCKPVAVTGADSSALRESLILGSSSLSGLKDGLAVLSADGLVGKIARCGIDGAQVRLLTDPGFALTGQISQYQRDADGHVTFVAIYQVPVLVQGIGHGEMAVRSNIPMQRVKECGIDLNDVITLQDNDWPADLQGHWIGRITSIAPQSNAPLFADIRARPVSELMRLRQVMVLAKP